MNPTNAGPSLPQVFLNLAEAYPNILYFLEALCYGLGLIFAVMSLLHLSRQHGGGTRAQINNNSWLWGLGVAIALFTLPAFIDSISAQIFGATPQNPLNYAKASQDGTSLKPLAGALQIFGMWFSIKGLLVLRSYGLYARQYGDTVGKGMTMIVSGVLLVNLDSFLGILSKLTGLNVGAGLFS